MNGGGTRTQKAMGVPDSKEIFEEDMIRGATGTAACIEHCLPHALLPFRSFLLMSDLK
jgi:hypothetical protein